jgi:hypothetical protein
VPDLAKPDQARPRFAARALDRGLHSMLSLRLFMSSEALSALTLCSGRQDAFTTDSEILADLVAQHAAVTLAGVTHEHHLTAALVNRDVLGQAKGILMHRDRLTGLQAFDLLVRASQAVNMRVAHFAQWLVTDTESHPHDDTHTP